MPELYAALICVLRRNANSTSPSVNYTNGKQVEFWFSMGTLDEAEENIAHYRSRLQIGAEPGTRAALLRLLLAEEKMLGRTREQLSRIDRHIGKLQRIIAQQEKRIGRMEFVGIGSERGTLLLSTLTDLMATYRLHRQWITAEVADSDGA